MTHTIKVPKLPPCPVKGWKWAAGFKPMPKDKYFWSSNANPVMDIGPADLSHEKYPEPNKYPDGWSGYIRKKIRRIKRKGK